MALTDTTLRNAKPRETQYKLHDDGGLFVIVRPSGGKLWRFKYRFAGKEQQLSIGIYPDVGLKTARARHDEARALLAEGIDPGADRKRKAIAAEIAAADTFGAVATEFVEKRERDGMTTIAPYALFPPNVFRDDRLRAHYLHPCEPMRVR